VVLGKRGEKNRGVPRARLDRYHLAGKVIGDPSKNSSPDSPTAITWRGADASGAQASHSVLVKVVELRIVLHQASQHRSLVHRISYPERLFALVWTDQRRGDGCPALARVSFPTLIQ
jgi:hypothetical protein